MVGVPYVFVNTEHCAGRSAVVIRTVSAHVGLAIEEFRGWKHLKGVSLLRA